MSESVKVKPIKKSKPFLYDFQMDAVNRAFVGCILNGGTGSGKSRTGLYFYFKEEGGWIDENGYVPMKNPRDLLIVSTAAKRDKLEWEGELANFHMSTNPEANRYDNTIVVDSWQNIKKYADLKGWFVIFDEDKVCGTGAWAQAFLKITKNNDWIMLSATAGDRWEDYMSVFIANGFYKNKTEFKREHLVYSYYGSFPRLERYLNTGRLLRLRNKILIDMDFDRHTTQHHEAVYCSYDISKYKDVFKNRWDPYKNEPLKQASELCYLLRKIVNSDESRQAKLLELLEDHPRAIIFYSYDYERDILLNLGYDNDIVVAEWTGHKHEPIPDSEKWVYIVNYSSGAEGFNCTKTDTIIFYSQTYSYKTLVQAAGRIDRLTTPYTDLYYYHLKSRSGIDLAISKALQNKRNLMRQGGLNGSRYLATKTFAFMDIIVKECLHMFWCGAIVGAAIVGVVFIVTFFIDLKRCGLAESEYNDILKAVEKAGRQNAVTIEIWRDDGMFGNSELVEQITLKKNDSKDVEILN